MVAEGLKTLTEKERAAVVLRDIEGLSTREVARVLGTTEITVRSHISRARLKMKRFLEERAVMSCRCYERWIALFVEGDLPPRKSRRLEEHLASCERCGELLHGSEESQASVKALAEVALPASVLQEMRQAVSGGD